MTMATILTKQILVIDRTQEFDPGSIFNPAQWAQGITTQKTRIRRTWGSFEPEFQQKMDQVEPSLLTLEQTSHTIDGATASGLRRLGAMQKKLNQFIFPDGLIFAALLEHPQLIPAWWKVPERSITFDGEIIILKGNQLCVGALRWIAEGDTWIPECLPLGQPFPKSFVSAALPISH